MQLTPTEALKRISVSADTLYKDMKRGRLSFEKKGSRKRLIDVSELERVYGPLKSEPDEATSDNIDPDIGPYKARRSGESPQKNPEIAFLRQQLETLADERRREREQTQEQIDDLKGALRNAQEQQTRLTALLTDQRQDKDQKEKQEQAQLIRELRVGYARLRQELQDVREQKGFFARWLGAGGRTRTRRSRPAKAPVSQEASP